MRLRVPHPRSCVTLLSAALLTACPSGDDADTATTATIEPVDTDTSSSTDPTTTSDTDSGTETDTETGTETETGGEQTDPWLLVGNTRADNVIQIDPSTGAVLGELVSPGAGGLVHPDTLRIRDGMLYVASGDVPEESAILRYELDTGAFIDEFATGGGMHRPYGFAFGPDGTVYVASFLSDQLLRFDAQTGDFVDVFAVGDAMPGGLNGPNDVGFGPDGGLYVSTQGSVAVDGAPTYPGLPSEVLRFDVGTGDSTVFIDQPTPLPDSLGFVSMLGVAWGPDCESGDPSACEPFTTDYAGGLRRYDDQGALLWEVSTTHMPGAATGALAFGDAGEVFVPGFVDDMTPGVVMRFAGSDGAAMPAMGLAGALFTGPDAALVRPIGVAFVPPS